MVFTVALWVWVVMFVVAILSSIHDLFTKETVRARYLAAVSVTSCLFVLYVFLLQLGVLH